MCRVKIMFTLHRVTGGEKARKYIKAKNEGLSQLFNGFLCLMLHPLQTTTEILVYIFVCTDKGLMLDLGESYVCVARQFNMQASY